MPKIQNSFLRGRMNKDFDERLVPKGEYLEAQNILITQSEGSDVGAIENILGNALAKNELSLSDDTETIGYYVDVSSKRVFWFVTDFNGSLSSTVRNMARPSSGENIKILMANIDSPGSIKTLVQGAFLNFSKRHLITGVNLIDDLLFFTDDYNQPRKINITKAENNKNYYTKEEQISVAKVSPYLAPILYNEEGKGDGFTLTKDTSITSDYLRDKFVRFSYRYKYEDGEYTTMAPFTQIVFKPLSNATIEGVLTTDIDKSDEQDIYSKTIVDIMKNDYNRIDLRIPLPSDEQALSTGSWKNDLRISKIEILIKESDEDVVKVIKEIDVSNDAGNTLSSFSNKVESYVVSPSSEDYYRYAYKFIYRSEEPYKILEDKQITRVFDQVPLRAKAQEISGNRVIYANFTENYDLPKDESGKTGINYVINNINKGNDEFSNINSNVGLNDYSVNTYKYHSLKQRRTYQVGVVLADKFGRQSPVILSTHEDDVQDGMADTITIPNVSEDLSTTYNEAYSWSNQQEAIGKSLSINFKDNRIVDVSDIYNGDINSRNYNPYGWYSYKIVVKQQEQEYYNIYTNHPADNWNNESNAHDDVLGYSWVSLYGDNINKVTRDVSEVDEVREGVAGSDTRLFPKVIKKETTTGEYTDINNSSTFGADIDSTEVMTIGTAREQGILTREDRDKDRVHDFIMAKRNPLLAQLKGLQTNNRVKFSIDVVVNENNSDDNTYFEIGDGNTINPYIRVGQQVTLKVGSTYNFGTQEEPDIKEVFDHTSNVGKKIIDITIRNNEQENVTSKTVLTDGKEISSNRGDSAMMRVGQFIEYRSSDDENPRKRGIIKTSSATTAKTLILFGGDGVEEVFEFLANFPDDDSFEGYTSVSAKKVLVSGEAGNNTFNSDTATFIVSGVKANLTSGLAPDENNLSNNVYTFTLNQDHANDTVVNDTIFFNFVDQPQLSGRQQILAMNNPSYEQIIAANFHENLFLDATLTTSTRVEQGNENFTVRRPILQKAELNKDSKKTILHFDRRVLPIEAELFGKHCRQKLALFDPLTIKSIETVTQGSKVFQKIKLSHDLTLEAGNQLVIQNLEEEPIAVNTGLSVFETDPVKSRLDIFYETSTSGLISDLNELTTTSVSTGYPINLEVSFGDVFTEASAVGSIIAVLNAETTTSDGSLEFELENVTRSPNEDVTDSFEIVGNNFKLLSGFHFKPESNIVNLNGVNYNFLNPYIEANVFTVNYKVKDTESNEYTSASAEFTMNNTAPSVSFNNPNEFTNGSTISLTLGSGGIVASGSYFNGSSNSDLDDKDVILELFNHEDNQTDLVWGDGLPLFEINFEDTPNEFNIKLINTGGGGPGEFFDMIWIANNVASEDFVLKVGVRIIDAGGNSQEIVKTIDFDATNNGSVNASDKRKSIVFMDRTSDGNSQTSICTGRPFDPKTTVFVDKGLSEAVPNPENRLDYTDTNGNIVYNQNYFQGSSFNVPGFNIYQNNRLFTSTDGTSTYNNKTFRLFYEYRNVNNTLQTITQYIFTDENGYVTNDPQECPTNQQQA
jgi:hypothetical protein